MISRRLLLAGAALALLPLAGPSGAAEGDGRIILQIDGKLEGGRLEFSRADLEKLGLTTIRTATPWHDGVQVFEGVELSRLMQVAKARGETVEVTALNRYRSAIPVADFEQFRPILALKRGGEYLQVKDKGPLFVIYPFDDRPELKTEQYYGRAVWQVRSITVE
ncbi:oxidoreductase [Prosthecomicrobium sp. N25]|uniref:oxidoreductase n=1 Tax=Prosthecomicrobium sp. N25 TaxID=3129254 RepID=UPI0030779CB6